MTLPGEVRRALVVMLREAAQGHTVAVVSIGHEDLTTTQAARLLGVSRPHVVKLIGNGILPSRRTGTARRVHATDVAEYQRTLENRHSALDELAADAQEIGLYGTSSGADSTRRPHRPRALTGTKRSIRTR